MMSIANNLDTTRSQSFTYDQLNRITAAQTISTHATSPSHCWGEIYSVDAWGNLTQIAATTNSNYIGCLQESGFSALADGNNHLSAFSYDLSGNTQNDASFTYTWDGESQLKTAAGVSDTGAVTYAYDGDGRRASKSTTVFVGHCTGNACGPVPTLVPSKIYWYGSGSEILAETDAAGSTTAEYIFFGGKRIAMLPSGGTPIYYVEDLLGTSRVTTTNSGVVCYDADFYPYGGERIVTDTCPQNNYKFEGKERDTETGNDDFGARYYSNRFGRWLSSDWSAVPVAVPYANLSNPQTLNLYSMVSDDPESFADLDGHCDADDWCGSVAGVALGTLKFVGHNLEAAAVSAIPVYGPMKAGKDTAEAIVTAAQDYYNKGVSGVANQLLGQGREGATEIVTEAVLTGGLAASGKVDSVLPEGTVTRYMGPEEAATATKTGEIPNTNAKLQQRPTHVTTDEPLDSAGAAKAKYELPASPTHRATVPASRAGKLGPTPDGRPTTSGGGSQAATNKPIPVKPNEIKKLKE